MTMKVTIQNLGIIQKAEIDLKPLTVLIGPNNAGKTWLAYTIAGIFGSHGRREYAQAYLEEKLLEKYTLLDNAVEKVLKDGSATINLVEFAEQYGESYFQHVADYAQEWMSDFMSTQLAVFDTMKVSVELAEVKAAFIEQVKQSAVQINVARAFIIQKRRENAVLFAYTVVEEGETITDKIPIEEIRERLVSNVFHILHKSLYSEIHVFPTERAALVTFGSNSDSNTQPLREIARMVRELSEMYEKQTTPQKPKKGAVPVDYFRSMLRSIYNIGSKDINKRERDAQSNQKIQKYRELSDILEREILGGQLKFSTPEPHPRRDILFHSLENDISIEISIASAMVKELALLVLYLRYLAQTGELLIIDEPEMNLHPEAQAQIIEFLAMLVKAGLRVLVTTHSTYVVDHLVNLVQAAGHEAKEQEELANMFFLEHTDAFISQEEVSVYLIDHGTAENILHGSKIDWSTFGDITDQVSEIHFNV
jgi:predicted ATP-dependent endonuclease of OLD family